jgi:hypothetical protein
MIEVCYEPESVRSRVVEKESEIRSGNREWQVGETPLIPAPDIFFWNIVAAEQYAVVHTRDIDVGAGRPYINQDHVKSKLLGIKHHFQVVVPRKCCIRWQSWFQPANASQLSPGSVYQPRALTSLSGRPESCEQLRPGQVWGGQRRDKRRKRLLCSCPTR